MRIRVTRLPAEWEPQDAVLLTWPHADTDWKNMLNNIEETYFSIVDVLSNFTPVIIAHHPILSHNLSTIIAQQLGSKPFPIACYEIITDDVWARDHGPICIEKNERMQLLDFTFNGWGDKFSATYDNQVSRKLHQQNAFGNIPLTSVDMVLEGGAIESDGEGCLLTTSECLCHPNRNPSMSKGDIEHHLTKHLGAKKVLWLDHGFLAGDDTDSHIDTLARFAPNNTIVYVSCDDPEDEHFTALQKMHHQLTTFTSHENQSFTLIPLPWPCAKHSSDGHRLPATYANYLITNNAVLVPIYQDKNDAIALQQIAKAYPNRQIVAIDCLNIIEQHGSLHCITMQIPKNVSH